MQYKQQTRVFRNVYSHHSHTIHLYKFFTCQTNMLNFLSQNKYWQYWVMYKKQQHNKVGWIGLDSFQVSSTYHLVENIYYKKTTTNACVLGVVQCHLHYVAFLLQKICFIQCFTNHFQCNISPHSDERAFLKVHKQGHVCSQIFHLLSTLCN